MARKILGLVLTLAMGISMLAASVARAQTGGAKGSHKLSLAELEDKVKGGWAGQMIGVSYGAPTEFEYPQKIIREPRPWKPEELADVIEQDDLYVEMTFAAVMDRIGLDATTQQYGEAFRDSKYSLWEANLAARRALWRGIKAPLSGHPDYNLHPNCIDFQIESDFIGLMCPGLPRAVQRYASRVGHVMNYGDGVYGGIFMGAMYAAAFVEKDPRKVVEAGLATIPPGSVYAQTIRDVLRWSAESPDWKKTWSLIEAKWDDKDICSTGALRPYNVDANINGAYVALGLLYGGGDFDRTIDIAMRAGQDSDCNPSSAGGILGTMIGYRAIPAKWTAPLPAIADTKFAYTDYSFNSIVKSTLERAKLVVKSEGGQVDTNSVVIPAQEPAELPLEQFQPGRVIERIKYGDARWIWQGTWEEGLDRAPDFRSSTAGAEATVKFEGTGALLIGPLLPDGGVAEVYLDGQLMRKIDVFHDRWRRPSEGLWGKFDLPAGPHTLRVVVKGEPYPGSKGAWVAIEDIVVFGTK